VAFDNDNAADEGNNDYNKNLIFFLKTIRAACPPDAPSLEECRLLGCYALWVL
jgi:hypothetical protein